MASGVDTDVFHPREQAADNGVPTVLFPARMLRTKGLVEFVEAARRLGKRNVRAHFVLAGGSDPQNPLSVSEDQVRAWAEDAQLDYLGDCLGAVFDRDDLHTAPVSPDT